MPGGMRGCGAQECAAEESGGGGRAGGAFGKGDAAVGPGAGETDHLAVAGGGGGFAVGRDADRVAGGVGLYHLAAADDHADVAGIGGGAVGAGEEGQVTGFVLAGLVAWGPGG